MRGKKQWLAGLAGTLVIAGMLLGLVFMFKNPAALPFLEKIATDKIMAF